MFNDNSAEQKFQKYLTSPIPNPTPKPRNLHKLNFDKSNSETSTFEFEPDIRDRKVLEIPKPKPRNLLQAIQKYDDGCLEVYLEDSLVQNRSGVVHMYESLESGFIHVNHNKKIPEGEHSEKKNDCQPTYQDCADFCKHFVNIDNKTVTENNPVLSNDGKCLKPDEKSSCRIL